MSWIPTTIAAEPESSPTSRPFRIHFPRSLALDIQFHVSSATGNFSRTDVDVYGVLFGTHSQTELLIGAQLPAPSFPISQRFAAIKSLLDTTANDPKIAGYEPVGYYVLCTHGELSPSDAEVEFFKQFFPEPWQVILALQPHSVLPSRARFFAALNGSALVPVSSEFIITFSQPDGGATTQLTRNYGGRSRLYYFRGVALAAIICSSLGFLWWTLAYQQPPTRRHPTGSPSASVQPVAHPFTLALSDINGQLRITWDQTAMLLLNAKSGILHIEGNVSYDAVLSGDELRRGALVFMHGTPLGTTRIRLEVDSADGGNVVQSALLVGMPSSPPFSLFNNPSDLVSRAYAELKKYVTDSDRMEEAATAQRLQRDQVLSADVGQPVTIQLRPFVPPISLQTATVEFPAIQPPPVNLAINVNPPALIFDPPLPQPLPQPLPPPPKPAVVTSHVTAAPVRSGMIVWSGILARRGLLEIQGNRASTGYLNHALPGVPVRIEAYPGEFATDGLTAYTSDPQSARDVLEPAGPENGWNALRYIYDPKAARDIAILEPPNAQTGWTHLILRSESRNQSVIIIRWRVP